MDEPTKTICAQDRMGNQFPMTLPESKANEFISMQVIVAYYCGPEYIPPEPMAAKSADADPAE